MTKSSSAYTPCFDVMILDASVNCKLINFRKECDVLSERNATDDCFSPAAIFWGSNEIRKLTAESLRHFNSRFPNWKNTLGEKELEICRILSIDRKASENHYACLLGCVRLAEIGRQTRNPNVKQAIAMEFLTMCGFDFHPGCKHYQALVQKLETICNPATDWGLTRVFSRPKFAQAQKSIIDSENATKIDTDDSAEASYSTNNNSKGSQSSTQNENTLNAKYPKLPKKAKSEAGIALRTNRGSSELKLIAALLKHHQYQADSTLNNEPITNAKLAAAAVVSEATASRFFENKFAGYKLYKAICKQGGIQNRLSILNGDVPMSRLSIESRDSD